MNTPYVYRLDHPVTGEFYIGYQSGTKKLGETYFTSSKRVKPKFHEFDVTEIHYCKSAQEAYDLEQFLIWADWYTPGRLNIRCTYGKGRWDTTGKVLTEKHKKKLSIISSNRKHTDETKQKIAESNRRRVLSDETKQKMSESAKKRPHAPMSDETKQKIRAGQLGKPKSAEQKAKQSAAMIIIRAKQKLLKESNNV